MSAPNPVPLPPPGSDAARKETVHMFKNIGGNFYEPLCKSWKLGRFTTDIRFVTCKKCIRLNGAELDAALSDLHMRPRTGAGGAE